MVDWDRAVGGVADKGLAKVLQCFDVLMLYKIDMTQRVLAMELGGIACTT